MLNKCFFAFKFIIIHFLFFIPVISYGLYVNTPSSQYCGNCSHKFFNPDYNSLFKNTYAQELTHINKIRLKLYSCYYEDMPAYFDIEKYLDEVLSKMGLGVVKESDQIYDATMYVSYIETKGSNNSVDIEYLVKLYDAATKELVYEDDFEGHAEKGSNEFVHKYDYKKPLDVKLAILLQKLNYLYDELKKNIQVVKFSHVVESLSRIDDLRSVTTLIKYLKDEDYNTCHYATRALGKMKNKIAVDPLVQVLNSDKEKAIRQRAAEALGDIGDKSATEPLIRVLDNRGLREAAVEALAKIGDVRAIEPILKDLEYKSWDYRIEASKALVKLGSEKGMELLIEYTKDKDEKIQAYAIEALAKIGGDDAVKHLLELLRDKNTRKRAEEELLHYLDFYEQAEICKKEILIDALKYDDPFINYLALRILAKAKDPMTANILTECMKSENQDLRLNAISAIRKEGYRDCRAIPALIQALKDKSNSIRVSATQALGNFKCKGVDEALAKALNDEDFSVRRYASYSLGEIGGDIAITALIKHLETRREDIAAEALGKVDDKETLRRAVGPLIKAFLNPGQDISGPNEALIREAAEALGKIGDVRAVDALLERLGEESWVLEKIIIALGELGDKRALEPLISLVNELDDDDLFAYAARALSKLGEIQATEPLKKIFYNPDKSVYKRLRAIEAMIEILEKSRGK